MKWHISHVETYQGCVSSSHNAEAKPWMPLGYFYNHLLARDNGTRGRIHWQRSLETTWRRSEHWVTGRQEARLRAHTCRGHALHVLIISLFFCQAPQKKRLGHSCPFTQRGNMTFLWHFWDESNNKPPSQIIHVSLNFFNLKIHHKLWCNLKKQANPIT